MQKTKASLNRENGDALLTDVNGVFSLVESILVGFPILGLEHALEIIPDLVEGIMKARANVHEKKNTVEQIKELLDLLKSVGDSIADQLRDEDRLKEIGSSKEFQTQVKILENKLAGVLSFVQNYRHKSWWPNLRSQNQDEFLAIIRGRIVDVREDFKSEGGLMILQIATEMAEKMNETVLDRLKPANASFTSALSEEKNHLTPGTRTSILRHMNEWVQSSHSSRRIYVLHGRAGTGKSSVAHALCRSLASTHLGASFFFARGSGECNDAYRLFPTLAFQLARSKPELCRFVVAAAKDHTRRYGAGRQQLEYQYLDLIASVFSKAGTPLLIVLDGVDECLNKPDSIVPDFLQRLCTATRDHPYLRILITTRPEAYIMNVLESSEFSDLAIFRDLGQEEDVDHDITLYTKSILRENPNGGPFEIGEDVVENLTRLSEGLFIYASTVVPFLAHAGYDAVQIYDDLVKTQGQDGPWRMYKKLDDIYSTVLKIAFEDLENDEKHMRQVQRILCWLALYRPRNTVRCSLHGVAYLSAERLEFVDIPTDITLYVMDRLRSVLTMEGQLNLTTELKVSHSSFAQFIVDPKRCRDPLFYVGTEERHKNITLDLLALLSRGAAAMLWSNSVFVGMLEYAFFELPHHLECNKAPLADDVRVALQRYLDKCLGGDVPIQRVVGRKQMALVPDCFILLRASCKTTQAGAEIDALLDNIIQCLKGGKLLLRLAL